MSTQPDNRIYQLCSSLAKLYRQDEALLFNYQHPNPLYFARGGHTVARFIAAIAEAGVRPAQISSPDYQVLLQLLQQHGIITAPDQTSGSVPVPATAPPAAPSRIHCYLLLSQYCNLACTYCFNGETSYERPARQRMSAKVAFAAIEFFLDQLAPNGVLQLIFFGGEPLLNWELARQILKHYGPRSLPNGKSIRFHLTSNLFAWPVGLLEDIAQYHISILCDIDGPPQYHNQLRPCPNGGPSYDAIVKHLQLLRDHGISYQLRATITSSNLGVMPQIVAHHLELGGTVSSLVALNPVTSDETVLPASMLPDPSIFAQELLKIYQSGIIPTKQLYPLNQMLSTFKIGGTMYFPCGAPMGTTPTVDVNGDIYPCIYFVGISRLKWGTLWEKRNLYQAPLLQELQRATTPDHLATCRECWWKYFCGGGCPVKRVLIEANPQADAQIKRYCQTISCLPAKTLFPELIWEHARRQHHQYIQQSACP